MDYEIAIFNALLYIIIFIFYWQKHKEFDIFSTVLLSYVIVSIFGCIIIYQKLDFYHLSPFNFIYLFTCVMIFIWPFRYARFSSNNISIVENRGIKILLAIYFITGTIALIYAIPRTIALAQIDDWGKIRNAVYEDSSSIELYGSQFERLMKNIYNYLSPFGLVMAIYQFTKKKYNPIFAIALLLVWGANTYCDSTVVASRGSIVIMTLNVILVFLIFKKAIPQKRKRLIYLIGIGFAAFFMTYLMAVSQSRFKDDAGDSVLWYMGQSMNVFNQDIMTPMHSYANGKYFFKWLCPLFNVNPDINYTQLGSTHGVHFMTFVGCFYIDFGPIGTLLCGIIMCRLLMSFTRKSHYYLSDLIVIVYYAKWYINGALVLGRSQSLVWLMLFVVYFIVRNLEVRRHQTQQLSHS